MTTPYTLLEAYALTPTTTDYTRIEATIHERDALKAESDRRGLAEKTWRGRCEAACVERDALRAQRDAAVEALEAAAKSLESASAHYKVDDDNVRAYCLSRATVARAALLLARGTP